jgi:hypothetical protein
MCDGRCIDPLSEVTHCGATPGCGGRLGGMAGNACTDDKICIQGVCSTCTIQIEHRVNLPVAGNPVWFDTADINSDGNVDVVYSELTSEGEGVATSAFIGQGGFAFAPASVLTEKTFRSLNVIDINKDNKADLVSIDYVSQDVIAILLGDGAGAFTAAPTVSCGTERFCREIAIADVNEDGNMDIIGVTEVSLFSSGQNQAFVALGPAFTTITNYSIGESSGFLSGPGPVVARDLNNDHHVDFVVLSQPATIHVFLNNGDASGKLTGLPAYTVPKSSSGDLLYPAVGDLDGDGNQDMLFGNTDAGVMIFGAGDGTFPVIQESTELTASDYAVGVLLANGRAQIVSGPKLVVRQLSSRSTLESFWVGTNSPPR